MTCPAFFVFLRPYVRLPQTVLAVASGLMQACHAPAAVPSSRVWCQIPYFVVNVLFVIAFFLTFVIRISCCAALPDQMAVGCFMCHATFPINLKSIMIV